MTALTQLEALTGVAASAPPLKRQSGVRSSDWASRFEAEAA